jgi:hypothetical protein
MCALKTMPERREWWVPPLAARNPLAVYSKKR